MVGADRVGHEVPRPGKCAIAHQPVVEAVEGNDVGSENVLADHVQYARIDASALLCPGALNGVYLRA